MGKVSCTIDLSLSFQGVFPNHFILWCIIKQILPLLLQPLAKLGCELETDLSEVEQPTSRINFYRHTHQIVIARAKLIHRPELVYFSNSASYLLRLLKVPIYLLPCLILNSNEPKMCNFYFSLPQVLVSKITGRKRSEICRHVNHLLTLVQRADRLQLPLPAECRIKRSFLMLILPLLLPDINVPIPNSIRHQTIHSRDLIESELH